MSVVYTYVFAFFSAHGDRIVYVSIRIYYECIYSVRPRIHMDRRIPFRLCDHSPNAPVRENYDEHIIMEAVVGFVYMFLI